MSEHATSGGTPRRSRWRIAAWAAAGALVSVPWIAMQFTDEVAWSAFDFVAFAALVGAAGALLELVVWKVRSTGGRAAACVAIATAFLLLWAQGAVGLFD